MDINKQNTTKETTELKHVPFGAKIFIIIFTIWFLGSIIGLFIAAKNGSAGWILLVLGQYFLFFGILASLPSKRRQKILKDEKTDNKGLMLFIVVGLGMFIIGGLLLAGVEIETTIIGAVAGMLFAFVGILFLPEFFQKRRHLRQVCTTKVDARVVKVDSRLSTDDNNRPIRLYDPIYEFQLKGKNG